MRDSSSRLYCRGGKARGKAPTVWFVLRPGGQQVLLAVVLDIVGLAAVLGAERDQILIEWIDCYLDNDTP
jgi:hypothetical protein